MTNDDRVVERVAPRTRAEHAREALMAAIPKDYFGNIGLNESYRMALDDMVAWIDVDSYEPPFTGYGKCNHDFLSERTTLKPILRPLKDSKVRPNTICGICKGDFSFDLEA